MPTGFPTFGRHQFPYGIQLSASGTASGGAFTGGNVIAGTGSPENSLIGWVGDLYLRRDGGANTTLYVKESGNGTNTGWIAK